MICAKAAPRAPQFQPQLSQLIGQDGCCKLSSGQLEGWSRSRSSAQLPLSSSLCIVCDTSPHASCRSSIFLPSSQLTSLLPLTHSSSSSNSLLFSRILPFIHLHYLHSFHLASFLSHSSPTDDSHFAPSKSWSYEDLNQPKCCPILSPALQIHQHCYSHPSIIHYSQLHHQLIHTDINLSYP